VTRVLVSGSRTWQKNTMIRDILRELPDRVPSPITLVVGEARGVDRYAAKVARDLGWRVEVHTADWRKHRKGAGMVRNQEMVRSGVTLGLFFIRKESPGASGCLRMAIGAGVPSWVFRDD